MEVYLFVSETEKKKIQNFGKFKFSQEMRLETVALHVFVFVSFIVLNEAPTRDPQQQHPHCAIASKKTKQRDIS